MKFYHAFYTDLPDQFVEANAKRLIAWCDGWDDKNRYYRRSMIIDGVAIDFVGDAKVNDYPTFKASSQLMLATWMQKKGDQYIGRYWDTLAEDQRSPGRIPRGTRRDVALTSRLARPGQSTLSPADLSRAYASFIGAGGSMPMPPPSSILQIMRMMAEEEVKPPLKREGVVAGEIVGYRCWRIEHGFLRSVYQSDVWQPGEVLAGRELGDWDSRGIHAWKASGSKQYHEYIRGYLNRERELSTFVTIMRGNLECQDHDLRPAMVTGTVFLWGDVVEHERGWRAEFARVRSLDWLYPDATMMGREQAALDNLRRLYRVDRRAA